MRQNRIKSKVWFVVGALPCVTLVVYRVSPSPFWLILSLVASFLYVVRVIWRNAQRKFWGTVLWVSASFFVVLYVKEVTPAIVVFVFGSFLGLHFLIDRL